MRRLLTLSILFLLTAVGTLRGEETAATSPTTVTAPPAPSLASARAEVADSGPVEVTISAAEPLAEIDPNDFILERLDEPCGRLPLVFGLNDRKLSYSGNNHQAGFRGLTLTIEPFLVVRNGRDRKAHQAGRAEKIELPIAHLGAQADLQAGLHYRLAWKGQSAGSGQPLTAACEFTAKSDERWYVCEILSPPRGSSQKSLSLSQIIVGPGGIWGSSHRGCVALDEPGTAWALATPLLLGRGQSLLPNLAKPNWGQHLPSDARRYYKSEVSFLFNYGDLCRIEPLERNIERLRQDQSRCRARVEQIRQEVLETHRDWIAQDEERMTKAAVLFGDGPLLGPARDAVRNEISRLKSLGPAARPKIEGKELTQFFLVQRSLQALCRSGTCEDLTLTEALANVDHEHAERLIYDRVAVGAARLHGVKPLRSLLLILLDSPRPFHAIPAPRLQDGDVNPPASTYGDLLLYHLIGEFGLKADEFGCRFVPAPLHCYFPTEQARQQGRERMRAWIEDQAKRETNRKGPPPSPPPSSGRPEAVASDRAPPGVSPEVAPSITMAGKVAQAGGESSLVSISGSSTIPLLPPRPNDFHLERLGAVPITVPLLFGWEQSPAGFAFEPGATFRGIELRIGHPYSANERLDRSPVPDGYAIFPAVASLIHGERYRLTWTARPSDGAPTEHICEFSFGAPAPYYLVEFLFPSDERTQGPDGRAATLLGRTILGGPLESSSNLCDGLPVVGFGADGKPLKIMDKGCVDRVKAERSVLVSYGGQSPLMPPLPLADTTTEFSLTRGSILFHFDVGGFGASLPKQPGSVVFLASGDAVCRVEHLKGNFAALRQDHDFWQRRTDEIRREVLQSHEWLAEADNAAAALKALGEPALLDPLRQRLETGLKETKGDPASVYGGINSFRALSLAPRPTDLDLLLRLLKVQPVIGTDYQLPGIIMAMTRRLGFGPTRPLLLAGIQFDPAEGIRQAKDSTRPTPGDCLLVEIARTWHKDPADFGLLRKQPNVDSSWYFPSEEARRAGRAKMAEWIEDQGR